MLISYNWLKKFVGIPKSVTPEKLAELLTMSTVEVESVCKQGELLDKVVVGRVVKLEQHPNADKLRVAYVDIGSLKNPKSEILNPKQIQNSKSKFQKVVCGGINLKEGMPVAFAKVGARVKWHGEGEPVVLEKAKIRDVESEGMICSAEEIGLENLFPQESEAHIVDLSNVETQNFASLQVGQPLAEALGLDDIIIEIENKSLTNRPDLWSHYGMAREIGALLKSKVKSLPKGSLREKLKVESKVKSIDKLGVEIRDNKKCPRYLGVVIDNIKIGPSPLWMAKQLEAVGVRSINNIVDITNYVLMEFGQPLHAFDYKKLANPSPIKSRELVANIIVRCAKQDEKITTLDGVERQLTTDDLVIADSKRPVALAGVMGGAGSEISDRTTKIIIESANFEASGIRSTETRAGLRTEASIRFEKALDPELAEIGIKRAVELIIGLIPQARITSPIVDVGTYKPKRHIIQLDLEYLHKMVGIEILPEKVIKILESLEFRVAPQASSLKHQALSVEVPSFRATKDVKIQEDLVEEIARIYGYQNIKPEMPKVKLEASKVNTERQLERQIKDILTLSFGFNEVQNYSFVNLSVATYFGYSEEGLIALENPMNPEQSYLRPNLLINLFKNIKENLRYFEDFKLFEIGRVFTKEKGQFNTDTTNKEFLPKQDKYLSGVVVGNDVLGTAKMAVDNLLERLGIDHRFVPSQAKVTWVDRERTLEIKSDGKTLGYITELCPKLLSKLKLTLRVAAFDINLTQLAGLPRLEVKEFEELPIYPGVTRDLAIVVSQGIMYQDIAELINSASPIITEVKLFDVYTGKKVGPGKRSLAFHLVFRAQDRTLGSKEVDKIFEQVVKKLEQKFKAKLRG